MKKSLIPVVELITTRLISIGLRSVVMSLHRPSKIRKKPALATETGFSFLLENGGRILLEKERTKVFPPREPVMSPSLLLENGGSLLSESGHRIKLENNNLKHSI